MNDWVPFLTLREGVFLFCHCVETASVVHLTSYPLVMRCSYSRDKVAGM
jgi:hypothetical protein